MVKITVDPYQAGTVNHATNNEMAKIIAGPYRVSTVNHAMNNELKDYSSSI